MSSPIVTGLMAYGMSGKVFHAPFLSTNPQFKLKAVVERNQKKMAADYPDIISYDSVDELLNDPEIELIIVNTPSFTHVDLGKRVLEAGKHVLIEKPVSATAAEAKELFDLGKKVNRQVMVYQNRRWDSDFLSVKEVIESGRLGRLAEMHIRYDRYKPELAVKPFKEGADIPAAGIRYDLGAHIVDQAIHLFGKPLSFDRVDAIQRDRSENFDYMNLRLVYPGGLVVSLVSGLLIPDQLPAFVVHGTLGTFSKHRCDVQEPQLNIPILPNDEAYGVEPVGCDGKLVTIGIDEEKSIEFITAPKGDYNNLFYAVYHAIRENALYPITEEHIIWQMEMLE
jgi:scyllo-inositol 2-dehydrogenase (NADP+)